MKIKQNNANMCHTGWRVPCKQNLKFNHIALAPPKVSDGCSHRQGLILFLVTVKPTVQVSGAWDSTDRIKALLESTNPVLLA